jgi:single-strand DNA-binding protein
MANETEIHIVGNLTADPELRFTQNGHAVASCSVARTPRTFDPKTGEWRDGEALFLRCNIWRDQGEHVAESLRRGMRVIVVGRLRMRSFETREGAKRTVVEIDVDDLGPSLKYATATVVKVTKSGATRTVVDTDTGPDGGEDAWGDAPADRELVGAGAGSDKPPF